MGRFTPNVCHFNLSVCDGWAKVHVNTASSTVLEQGLNFLKVRHHALNKLARALENVVSKTEPLYHHGTIGAGII